MGIQQYTHQARRWMESHLPYTRRTLQTNSYVLWTHELPSHFPNDDKHHILQTSGPRLAFSLYGWSRDPYKMTPQRNRRRTLAMSQGIHPYHPQRPRKEWSLPQTWEVHLWTGRNWLFRHYHRTRDIKNGSEEDTRSHRLVPTNYSHRSKTIPGIHRILLILHPKLFKNCLTPLRPHEENDPIALEHIPIYGFQNLENLNVPKTHTPST